LSDQERAAYPRSVPPPVQTLVCVACEQPDEGSGRGWQGYLADLDDDGLDELVLFCPSCAYREFGEGAW
jgi:hypothetical protein